MNWKYTFFATLGFFAILAVSAVSLSVNAERVTADTAVGLCEDPEGGADFYYNWCTAEGGDCADCYAHCLDGCKILDARCGWDFVERSLCDLQCLVHHGACVE